LEIGRFEPACGGDQAVAGVNRDGDLLAVALECLVEKVGVVERCGTDDDAAGSSR